MIHNSSSGGFSLVEVVIGSALILLSVVGLVNGYGLYLKAGLRNTAALQAAFLLQEGVEAVTLMRDDGWSNLSSLSPGARYYLAWNGTRWSATTTSAAIDGLFLRTFTLDDVYRRDSDKDIVASSSPEAKSLDVNAKQLTMRVTASSTPPLTTQMTTYLTNLFE